MDSIDGPDEGASMRVIDGADEGTPTGILDGTVEFIMVMTIVGESDGDTVDDITIVGDKLGTADGASKDTIVGAELGTKEGASEDTTGTEDGDGVGASIGVEIGGNVPISC
jgi:hypothetical protein